MADPTPAASASTPTARNGSSLPLDSPSLPNGKTRQSLAAPPSAPGSAAWTSPLAPTTFTSLMPVVDGLLKTLAGLAESAGQVDGAEAGRAVVGSARDLFSSLERMKTAALELPGAHLSTERIEELTEIMREEAERKRAVLIQLANVKTPIADRLQRSVEGGGAEEMAEGDEARGSVTA